MLSLVTLRLQSLARRPFVAAAAAAPLPQTEVLLLVAATAAAVGEAIVSYLMLSSSGIVPLLRMKIVSLRAID